MNKYLSISDFLQLKKKSLFGKKIVFTNGCFDLLHKGHIYLLQEARKQGDILVVGINADLSIKRLKGSLRPIENLENRIGKLAQLECVDFIITFEEDTPIDLIQKIKPNVLVKGGDYNKDTIVGADLVENKGGNIVIIPLLEGISTSIIIENENYKSGK